MSIKKGRVDFNEMKRKCNYTAVPAEKSGYQPQPPACRPAFRHRNAGAPGGGPGPYRTGASGRRSGL